MATIQNKSKFYIVLSCISTYNAKNVSYDVPVKHAITLNAIVYARILFRLRHISKS